MKRKRKAASTTEDGPAPVPTKAVKLKKSESADITDDDSAYWALKHALAITPKTTNLLLTSGYPTYQSLANTTPNTILQQFAKHGNMDKRVVEGYRRAVRRMVWLGTQSDPETMAKRCQTWTIKNLTAKGIWVDDWDDLTGKEVDERFGEMLTKEGL